MLDEVCSRIFIVVCSQIFIMDEEGARPRITAATNKIHQI